MKTELRKISTYTVCKDECHFNEDIIKTLPNIKKKKDKKKRRQHFVDLIRLSSLSGHKVQKQEAQL